MNIFDIYDGIHGSGPNKGIPCVVVSFAPEGSGKTMTFNEVVLEIKTAGLKHVSLVGTVARSEGLQELAVGLAKTGNTVSLITNSSDEIETLRMVRNVQFSIHIAPEEGYNINLKTFPLLKKGDCVIIPVTTMYNYLEVSKLLDSRLISQPELIFEVAEKCSEFREIKEKILEDSKKRNASTRIYFI